MASFNYNLLEMDVDKLFEEHTVDEIVQVENLLDAEIEKKRIELRGMVGDRYKDVLAASDAIKSMKSISEGIVGNIQNITDRCETLIAEASTKRINTPKVVDPKVISKRTIIMQIRLAMVVNNEIWMALEDEDFSKAAQVYLLGQHIHTGLQLLSREVLSKLPILKRMKSDIDALRNRILKRAKEKLQTVELNAEETSSNLNALMLLEQYQNGSELINVFIDLRKTALRMVINEPHSSVRAQVTAMLRCLVATVHLLHECFINFKNTKRGLIWQQLESIVSENASPTLTKIILPATPLIVYIPDLIKQFRPKWNNLNQTLIIDQVPTVIENWLSNTSESIKEGLNNSLQLVTNIKGLHIIREEALKIELPPSWNTICTEINLPNNFHIWFYFFQALITNRAKTLIARKVSKNFVNLENSISKTLDDAIKAQPSESDLRWYTWKEDDGDVSRTENKHIGLSMKTKGYSASIVKLCTHIDQTYLDLLEDLSQYLYGIEYSHIAEQDLKFSIKESIYDRKHIDKSDLEDYLRLECSKNSNKLTSYLEEYLQSERDKRAYVTKSLVCARFLQALSELCPSFKKCCSCDGRISEWEKICNNFNKYSLQFWQNWISNCVSETEIIVNELGNISMLDMLHILPKWDNLEIQEQTDEKVFKSQIKIPSQPSLCLQRILTKISNQMSAIIPHTLPKQIHLKYIEINMQIILQKYEVLANLDLNQTQALQFLFDVKYITTMCIPRENLQLVSKSQSTCDEFRSKVDPFDLDVFYSYLQNNIKMCVLQSQVILGCLLPNAGQLASLGMFEKSKDHEKEPSVLAVSTPSTASWFPLLPVTAPVQKIAQSVPAPQNDFKSNSKSSESVKKSSNSVSSVRSGAAAFFGAMTNDWFS